MRGDMISQRGEAWANGQEVVSQGQRLIEKGNDRVADGQKKMASAKQLVAKAGEQIDMGQADAARGEQLVDKGKAQMQRAEASYTALRDGPSAVDTPSGESSTTAEPKADPQDLLLGR
ncbi:MAG: hypothetical protein WCY11_01505 [Novosphingobium sp.]|jgi:uncharacterized phage infection (PIP) family protein YhgE